MGVGVGVYVYKHIHKHMGYFRSKHQVVPVSIRVVDEQYPLVSSFYSVCNYSAEYGLARLQLR